MSPEELAAIRARYDRAALEYDPFRKRFPTTDAAVACLSDVPALVAEVERLHAALTPFVNAPKRFPGGQHPFVHVVVTEHDLDAAQEALRSHIHAALSEP